MDKNYTVYHLHTHLSNPTSGQKADSVARPERYVEMVRGLGMKAFGFSEHGNVFNWVKKKQMIEGAGMKYIHAVEIYVTESLEYKVRDNYHLTLIARNWEGVKEINQLTSKAFNRQDNSMYYNPRVSIDDIMNASENVIITTACLGNPLRGFYNKMMKQDENSEKYAKLYSTFLDFLIKNKHRCFLEVQYHNIDAQKEWNNILWELNFAHKIPFIAGTDTHSVDEVDAESRKLFLEAKGASYGDEDRFDLTLKSYDEVVELFKKQGVLNEEEILTALDNTNVMADMIEEFELDYSHKYPRLSENPEKEFKERINKGYVRRGIHKLSKEKQAEYKEAIQTEYEVYKKLDTIDYMLLQDDIIKWANDNDIMHGYGRGSVNGSIIAYLLGITEMDSLKYGLHFFRFMNPERISLADIDIDFPPSRRQDVIDYISTIEGVDFSEIITFNTLSLKGNVRMLAKHYGLSQSEAGMLSNAVTSIGGKDRVNPKVEERYPDIFKYGRQLSGVINSIGSHPSGFIVSPTPLSDMGTCYTSASKYKVSAINMKEFDSLNYVKLDVLGLANIEIINEACRMAGIERVTPDNLDLEDEDVWDSIRRSTLGVFQMESESAQTYLKQLFSDDSRAKIRESGLDTDNISLLAIMNGAIRPAGDSYRNNLVSGVAKDNGHEGLNDLLSDTLGYLVYQEQIMKFLVEFCGFSGAESDSVRRGLSKKEGTEKYLPSIKAGFMDTMRNKYGMGQEGKISEEEAEQVLEGFLSVIEDASDYAFSVNHSMPYSLIGYACGYLRYHHPLEFLSAMANVQGDVDRLGDIAQYAKSIGVEIKKPLFGSSGVKYQPKDGAIYKGAGSFKSISDSTVEELDKLYKENDFKEGDVVEFATKAIDAKISPAQLRSLASLDYFRNIGEMQYVLEILSVATADKYEPIPVFEHMIESPKKFPLKYRYTLKENTKEKRKENLQLYYDKLIELQAIAKPSIKKIIETEKDYAGYGISTFPELPKSVFLALEIDARYSPKIKLYRLQDGIEIEVKASKGDFYSTQTYLDENGVNVESNQMLDIGDVFQIQSIEKKNKVRPVKDIVDGKEKTKWEQIPNSYDFWLKRVKILKKS